MKITIALITSFICAVSCFAQKSSYTVTYKPAKQGNTITADLSALAKTVYAVNDYSVYWFINPHTGLHHFALNLSNMQNGASRLLRSLVEFNTQQNDYSFWIHPSPNNIDSNFFSVDIGDYVISDPLEYDRPAFGGTNNHNNPMEVHITTFTDTEIEFTITGNADYASQNQEKFLGYGTIEVHGHFYRKPGLQQSPVYAGCNCDPNIYAAVYETEEGDRRTASACEAAMKNRIFNAVQNALKPVYATSFTGAGKAPGGSITTRTQGFYDFSPAVAAKQEWPFDYDYKTLIRRGHIETQPRFYSDDEYGIELDEMPGEAATGSVQNSNAQAQIQDPNMASMQVEVDSLAKLMKDKKITVQEYLDKVKQLTTPANKNTTAANSQNQADAGGDFKKLNMESRMIITFSINPRENFTYMPLASTITAGDIQIGHTVKGAAWDIQVAAIKNEEGNWDKNKYYILLGKYMPPATGKLNSSKSRVVNILPVYPANGSKLNVYNILIKMEGGKDQITKALAALDLTPLLQLLTPQ